ncbi:hypothetical protein SCB71_06370 [Herbiconiux sp. KACC 21604]|uniref:hypothetical protein n=1 Tax=unclassified Herbiconiux TaxID=2618217 RepID=UPI001C0F9906|nr:hypothetical protein [Herbiconiux sp. SALV-R1]WPO87863.1 hypothetical protein SCB71_06370 [Herbiconiux sp. KACC 21604]
MAAKRPRDGKGHRAYRRAQASLRQRTKEQHLPCGYGSPSGWGCGEQIDTTLDARHARSFTADHDVAINNGGRLVGQTLVPMHRACNARKSDHATVEIWGAT